MGPPTLRYQGLDGATHSPVPRKCGWPVSSPAMGQPDPLPRAPRAMERQSSEVWCQPAGARKRRGRMLLSGLGPAPPGSNMPPHSDLGCRGPERIFDGATAMKPWKTSPATYENGNARLSFRLGPRWSGYGPILPQGTSRKPKPAGPREAPLSHRSYASSPRPSAWPVLQCSMAMN